MTCTACGGQLKSRREDYRYDLSGLPGITLVDVEVRRCGRCGDYEVAIPRIDALHRAIAQAVIRKPARLAGAEIRYLRKWLGWSGVDFAAHMGTTPETVSRWERGSQPIGPTADRLLRLMVTTRAPVDEYSLDVLKTVSAKPTPPVSLRVTRRGRDWNVRAA